MLIVVSHSYYLDHREQKVLTPRHGGILLFNVLWYCVYGQCNTNRAQDDVKDRRRRWSRSFIEERRRNRLQYVDLYIKKLSDGKLKEKTAAVLKV